MSKQPEGSGAPIEDKLVEAWKQEQRFFHLRGLGRFLIWVVAMVLVDFIVDWQIFFRARWETPGTMLLLFNALVLSWVLWRDWLRHLKPYDPLRVALEVENKHPKLRSVLVSFTQFKDFKAEETEASPELLEAMRKQAISLTRPLDFREVVDFGQLKRLAIVCLASIAFFLAISFQWEDHMRLLFQRLMGENVEYPTETTIVATSENITIKAGASAKLSALVEGKTPKQGTLFIRYESEEEWRNLDITRGLENSYSREIREVSEGFIYYVKIGDDYSEEHTVSISPKPEATKVNLTLTYPPYLGKAPDGSDSLQLTEPVPIGTRIKWTLQCEPAIESLKVTLGDRTIMAEVSPDGTQAVFEWDANETFKYSFHWTEKDHGFEYPDIQYLVRAVSDRIPYVELLEPSGNGVATVNKVLKLRAKAKDDHQLGAVTLVHAIGDKIKRIPIEDILGPQKEITHKTIRDGQEEWSLKKDWGEDLKPGVTLTFWFEATDKKPIHHSLDELRSILANQKDLTETTEKAKKEPETAEENDEPETKIAKDTAMELREKQMELLKALEQAIAGKPSNESLTAASQAMTKAIDALDQANQETALSQQGVAIAKLQTALSNIDRIAVSAKRKLRILTEDKYLAWFEGEMAAQREIILKQRDAEVDATNEVGKLKGRAIYGKLKTDEKKE